MCNTATGDGDPDDCWGGGFDANDVFVPLACWNGFQPYMTGLMERDRVTKGTWNQYTCCPPEPFQSRCGCGVDAYLFLCTFVVVLWELCGRVFD